MFISEQDSNLGTLSRESEVLATAPLRNYYSYNIGLMCVVIVLHECVITITNIKYCKSF